MASITTINPGVDTGFSTKLNNNFSALNTELTSTTATGHDHDGIDSKRPQYTISDDIVVSDYGVKNSSAGVYTKYREIKIEKLNPTPSTVRITFNIKTNNPTYPAYGRIYKNGGAVGTERINGTTSYIVYTEDISFTEGDLLQLYLKCGSATLSNEYFKIHGSIPIVPIITTIQL